MIDIILGVTAITATVEWVAPWIVKQQISYQHQLDQEQQQQLETQIEDRILNNGYRELPRVIVTPMGDDEPVRQQITIPGDDGA